MGTAAEFDAVKWLVESFPGLVGEGATARNGSPEEDMAHIADAWIDRPGKKPISVGVRMRSPGCHTREFTLRLCRQGRPTEFAAMRGMQQTYDWYLCIWWYLGEQGECVMDEFVLLDVNRMRDAGLFTHREGEWREKAGRPESYYAMDVEKLIKQNFALKARVFNRAPLPDFVEEVVGKDHPLRLLQV